MNKPMTLLPMSTEILFTHVPVEKCHLSTRLFMIFVITMLIHLNTIKNEKGTVYVFTRLNHLDKV